MKKSLVIFVVLMAFCSAAQASDSSLWTAQFQPWSLPHDLTLNVPHIPLARKIFAGLGSMMGKIQSNPLTLKQGTQIYFGYPANGDAYTSCDRQGVDRSVMTNVLAVSYGDASGKSQMIRFRGQIDEPTKVQQEMINGEDHVIYSNTLRDIETLDLDHPEASTLQGFDARVDIDQNLARTMMEDPAATEYVIPQTVSVTLIPKDGSPEMTAPAFTYNFACIGGERGALLHPQFTENSDPAQ